MQPRQRRAAMDPLDDTGRRQIVKRTFLKRGEGVQKRVFGPVIKKQRDVDRPEDGEQTPSRSDTQWLSEERRDVRPQPRDQGTPSRKPAWSFDDAGSPAAAPAQPSRAKKPPAGPGLTRSATTAVTDQHAGRSKLNAQLQDDMELAEFEALEEQIMKDLGHSSASNLGQMHGSTAARAQSGNPANHRPTAPPVRAASAPVNPTLPSTAAQRGGSSSWGRQLAATPSEQQGWEQTSWPADQSPGPYGSSAAVDAPDPYTDGSGWAVEDELIGVVSPEMRGTLDRVTADTLDTSWGQQTLDTTGSNSATWPQRQPSTATQQSRNDAFSSSQLTAAGPNKQHSAWQGQFGMGPEAAAATDAPDGTQGCWDGPGGASGSHIGRDHNVNNLNQQPTTRAVDRAMTDFEDDTESWGPQAATTLAVKGGYNEGPAVYHTTSTLKWFEDEAEDPAASDSNSYPTQPQQSSLALPDPSSHPPATAQGSVNSPPLTQPFVRSLFGGGQSGSAQSGGRGGQQHAGRGGRRDSAGGRGGRGPGPGDGGGGHGVGAADLERLQQLEQEVAKLHQERAALGKLRTDLEKAATRLEAERAAWERKQASESGTFEAWRAAEIARLERDRRVLDKQSKAILKLPTKKERSAVEAVEAVLEEERREARATAARHKLTVERLRRQLLDQQEKNRELREEIRWHEAQRLELTAPAGNRRPASPTTSVGRTAHSGLASRQGSSAGPAGRPAAVTASTGVQADLGNESLARVQLHEAAQLLLPHLDPPKPPAAAWSGRSTSAASSTSPQEGTRSSASQRHKVASGGAGQPGDGQDRWRATRGNEGHGSPQSRLTADRGFEVHQQQGRVQQGWQQQGQQGRGASPGDSTATHRQPARPGALVGQDSASDRAGQWAGSMLLGSLTDGYPDVYDTLDREQGTLDTRQTGDSRDGEDDVRGSLAEWTGLAGAQHAQQGTQLTQHAQQGAQPVQHGSQLLPAWDDRDQECVSQGAVSVNSAELSQLGSTLRLLRVERDAAGRAEQDAMQGACSAAAESSWQEADEQVQGSWQGPGVQSQRSVGRNPNQQQHPSPQGHWPAVDDAYNPSGTAGRTGDRRAQGSEDRNAGAAGSRPQQVDLGRQHPHNSVQGAGWGASSGQPQQEASHSQHSQHDQHHQHHSKLTEQDASHHYHHSQHHDSSHHQDSQQHQHSQRHHPTDGSSGQPWHQSRQQQQQPGPHSSRDPVRHTRHPSHSSATPQHCSSHDPVVRLVRHGDGRLDRYRASGRKDTTFANGTVKVVLPGGTTLIKYSNGDMKHQLPSGATEYYYAQVGTWHIQYEDQTEVYYFPNGQREMHTPGAPKQILFPDGATRLVYEDGREVALLRHQLSTRVQQPCPSNMIERVWVDEDEDDYCEEEDG